MVRELFRNSVSPCVSHSIANVAARLQRLRSRKYAVPRENVFRMPSHFAAARCNIYAANVRVTRRIFSSRRARAGFRAFSTVASAGGARLPRDSSRRIVLNFLIPYHTAAFRDGGNENTPSRPSFPLGPLHIT